MVMYYGDEGEIDEYYLPKMNLTTLGVSTAYLNYDFAHCGVAGTPSTTLDAMISTDCGASWTNINSITGSDLITAGNTNQYFTPAKTQWKSASIAIPNANTISDLMIKFVALTGKDGNFLWIDNINVADRVVITTAVDEFEANSALSMFPNPASEKVTIKLENGQEITGVTLVDNLGRAVAVNAEKNANGEWTLKLDKVAAGIYTVQVLNNQEVVAVSKLKVD